MSTHWPRRLVSLDGPAFLLALLLLVSLSVERWQTSRYGPTIDFLTLWSVPHVLATEPVGNIYARDDQLAMGAFIRREAAEAGATPIFRRAVALSDRVYDGRVEATSTPFTYMLVGWFSSRRYDGDLARFAAISFVAFVAALLILCRLLRFSGVGTIVAIAAFAAAFAPVLADVRVANINQIQLALLALFLWCTARSHPIAAGALLGFAVLLKPNLIMVPILIGLVGMIDRDSRYHVRLLGGMLLTTVVTIGMSSAYFGTSRVWWQFVESLPRTLGPAYPLEKGNLCLATLLYSVTRVQLSTAIAGGFLAVFAAVVWITRPRDGVRQRGPDARRLHHAFVATGAGCAMVLLAGRLAWLHYYTLLIPLALFLLRPIPDADAVSGRGIFGRLLAIAALVLLSGPVELASGDTFHEAIMVNAATVLLVGAGLDDLWRGRASGRSALTPDRRAGGAPALPSRRRRGPARTRTA